MCVWMILAIAGCRPAERAGTDRAAADPLPGTVSGTAPPARSGNPAEPLRYARVFACSARSRDTAVITVYRPWQGSDAVFTYLLVDSAKASAAVGASGATPLTAPSPGPGAALPPNTVVIRVPVRRAVTLTTTNLRHLEAVHALDALAGVGGGRYVCSPEIRARLASGRIRDVGDDMHLDLEAILAIRPDAIFTFVVGNSSDGGLGKLAEARVPAVIEGSYMEETPLGRAEWIKFTAAFFGKRAEADSAFAEVDSAYHALVALARKAAHRPTVMVGAPFGGVWWVPSGGTYVGRLLRDAGADYLWASDTTRGSLNLDVEAVLARAAEAEVWLNAGEWKDLADARGKDPRNALFRSWKTGRVYANDAVLCAGGGRDFFETGASRPDWILADLIAILHPELMPGHALRWYRKLPGPT